MVAMEFLLSPFLFSLQNLCAVVELISKRNVSYFCSSVSYKLFGSLCCFFSWVLYNFCQ